MMKEKMNLTIDSDIKKAANNLFKEKGVTASYAFENYCRDIIQNGYNTNNVPSWLESHLVSTLEFVAHSELREWSHKFSSEENDPLTLNTIAKMFELYLLSTYHNTMKTPESIMQDITHVYQLPIERHDLFNAFADHVELAPEKFFNWIKTLNDFSDMHKLQKSRSSIENRMGNLARSLNSIYTSNRSEQILNAIAKLSASTQEQNEQLLDCLTQYAE